MSDFQPYLCIFTNNPSQLEFFLITFDIAEKLMRVLLCKGARVSPYHIDSQVMQPICKMHLNRASIPVDFGRLYRGRACGLFTFHISNHTKIIKIARRSPARRDASASCSVVNTSMSLFFSRVVEEHHDMQIMHTNLWIWRLV